MKYIVIFMLAILTSNVRAQYVKKRHVNYEGSVELNSGASLNSAPLSLLGTETIHGILFWENYMFVGVGVGVNIVRFDPYVEKMTGDITPEMFHYDLHKYICPTASLNMGLRLNNIHKLGRKMIPFVNCKFMYLWNLRNTAGITVDFSEPGSADYSITHVDGLWGELSVGTELKLRDFPNIYVGIGWLLTSGGGGEGASNWRLSIDKDAEVEEGKIYSGSYKTKGSAALFIKVGIHLWGKK